MYYKINQGQKHGFEIFILSFFDARGKLVSSHEFMSEQGCRNKLAQLTGKR